MQMVEAVGLCKRLDFDGSGMAGNVTTQGDVLLIRAACCIT